MSVWTLDTLCYSYYTIFESACKYTDLKQIRPLLSERFAITNFQKYCDHKKSIYSKNCPWLLVQKKAIIERNIIHTFIWLPYVQEPEKKSVFLRIINLPFMVFETSSQFCLWNTHLHNWSIRRTTQKALKVLHVASPCNAAAPQLQSYFAFHSPKVCQLG